MPGKTASAAPATPIPPLFQGHDWHDDGIHASPTTSLETMAHDIGYGIRTLLQLLEADEVRTGRDDAPLLGSGERGDLLRLGMAAAYLLGRCASDRIDVHNTSADSRRQGGQA